MFLIRLHRVSPIEICLIVIYVEMVDVLDNAKKDQAATGGARAGGRRGNRGAFRAEGV